jgi:heptosyltransferase-1
MYILIVKTSSLGDVIHTLPALTDALQHYPNLQCDWLVEENFAEIPTWHPAVKRVIPVALRRWRNHLWHTWSSGIWQRFIQTLTQREYDLVIDAQGLLKSAVLTYLAKGVSCGLDFDCAREPLASLVYQKRFQISKGIHAVTRVRQLLATVLDYGFSDSLPDYGIVGHFQSTLSKNPPITRIPTIIFLHGTTWATKHWPDNYWQELAQRVTAKGYAVRLPWGNANEYSRAHQIAARHPNISLIPKTNLYGLAQEMVQAQAVVGVDTGLAHLAAALAIPSVTLYGATQPAWTGTYGLHQLHLQAHFPCVPCLKKKCIYPESTSIHPPCYTQLSVEKVWEGLQSVLKL